MLKPHLYIFITIVEMEILSRNFFFFFFFVFIQFSSTWSVKWQVLRVCCIGFQTLTTLCNWLGLLHENMSANRKRYSIILFSCVFPSISIAIKITSPGKYLFEILSKWSMIYRTLNIILFGLGEVLWRKKLGF